MEIITHSAQETKELGQKIATNIVKQGREMSARFIALYGELGSGKTTFVQGLAQGLGLPRRIVSPTFIIVREYPIARGAFKCFYHIDLYRIETLTDLAGLGFAEIFADPAHIVVIEWAEKLIKLPKKRIDIKFEQINETKRKVIFY